MALEFLLVSLGFSSFLLLRDKQNSMSGGLKDWRRRPEGG
jgi:hypothetical protein